MKKFNQQELLAVLERGVPADIEAFLTPYLQGQLTPEEEGAFYFELFSSYLNTAIAERQEYKKLLQEVLAGLGSIQQGKKELEHTIDLARVRADLQ